VIRQVLETEGVTSFAVDELAVSAASLLDIVQEAIDRSDIVVVVLPGQAPRENVIFELGFALACKKPILVIAEEKAVLPDVAGGIPYLRADLKNAEAIRFGLAHFLAAPIFKSTTRQTFPKQTRPLGQKADEYLEKLRELPKETRVASSHLEDLIADAIRASGVRATAQRERVGNEEIDIAVWSDDLEPWVGNPLLIEVKAGLLRGKGDLDSIRYRFHKAYGQGRPGWGLVIYRQAASDADLARVRHLEPTILFTSAKDFLEALRDSSFGELIIRMRNDRMHGRG
jgi:hypothetical protein